MPGSFQRTCATTVVSYVAPSSGAKMVAVCVTLHGPGLAEPASGGATSSVLLGGSPGPK